MCTHMRVEIDVSVQFDPTIYSVMEGSMAILRLVLSGPSTRPVVVQLSTENGTAFGKTVCNSAIANS